MTQKTPKILNPISWMILGLGACSAGSKITGGLAPQPQSVTYAYECKAGTESVGIRDLGGVVNVYRNNVIQYRDHHGFDLSFFLVQQYPTATTPLQAFALGNQDTQALAYYDLDLQMDLTNGVLSVLEEKYTRPAATDPWQFDSRHEILGATDCVAK